MAEEEVHGGVEVGVQPEHQDSGGVSHEGQEICNQDEHEEDPLQMGVATKPQTEEASLGTCWRHPSLPHLRRNINSSNGSRQSNGALDSSQASFSAFYTYSFNSDCSNLELAL